MDVIGGLYLKFESEESCIDTSAVGNLKARILR